MISRTRLELSAEFDLDKPFAIGRAPGALDIMGGVAGFTGSLVCQSTIDRTTEVILQERMDRQIQVFSFNLFDEHKPFTFGMSLDRLAQSSAAELRAGFAEPGRSWAAYVAGCLAVLHWEKLVDLTNPQVRGINFALCSDIPMNVGLGSSAALVAATMKSLLEHFEIRDRADSNKLVDMCCAVERELIGVEPSAAAQAIPARRDLGVEDGAIQRMRFQKSFEFQSPIRLPKGFQIVAISSGVRDKNAGQRLKRHLRAASRAHEAILSKMREMGRAAGRELIDDPMDGYLANLDPDDYKRFFRPYLIDAEVLGAADHHVLEARRVKQFCEFIEQAAAMDLADKQRYILMDKAGHLMYASHLSYMNDARLGSEQCDLLVKLVREREKSSLYGARMTGRGCGGTVAVLCEENDASRRAMQQIIEIARGQTLVRPELIDLQR